MITDKNQAITIIQTFLNKSVKDGVFENLNDAYTCILAWNLLCKILGENENVEHDKFTTDK